MIYHILTPLPLEFLPKTASRSMIVERFFGDHLAPVKRSKTTCTKTLFTSRALRWFWCVILLLQLLKSSGMSRRQNFEWFFGETFSFRFLASLLVACFTFIPPFLLLLGISFFKALLQVEKFSRTPRGTWISLQGSTDGLWRRFSLKCSGKSCMTFQLFFSGLFDWIAFNWVWLERSRPPSTSYISKLSVTVKICWHGSGSASVVVAEAP